jgi:hypothetical protein
MRPLAYVRLIDDPSHECRWSRRAYIDYGFKVHMTAVMIDAVDDMASHQAVSGFALEA